MGAWVGSGASRDATCYKQYTLIKWGTENNHSLNWEITHFFFFFFFFLFNSNNTVVSRCTKDNGAMWSQEEYLAINTHFEKARNWNTISLHCSGSLISFFMSTVTICVLGSITSGGSPLRSSTGGKPTE